MLNLPLYPLRGYELIFEVAGFKIVQTLKTRWVLDCPELEGDYFQRRMQLLAMDLPYKLYPLRDGVHTMGELISLRRRTKKFIDKNGTIQEWSPTKYYKAKSKPIVAKWIPNHVPKLCFALGDVSEIFSINLPNYVANYARVIEIGNRRILYDVTEERMPDTRIKL